MAPTLTSFLPLAADSWATGRDVLVGAGSVTRGEALLIASDLQESWRWDGLVQGSWKLLRYRELEQGEERLHLFRRDDDPLDLRDRALQEPERVQALLGRLQELRRELQERARVLGGAAQDAGAANEELVRQLQALGYVSSLDESEGGSR